jgi:F420H(2)-dependent biliverdin reductase
MSVTPAGRDFLAERHLATLTTLRRDGSPHVVPVGFTWDDAEGLARVIASGGSRKVDQAERHGVAVLCQVDGRRWLTLEGQAFVRRDRPSVAEAEVRYAERYQSPRVNPRRVVIEIVVAQMLGSPGLLVTGT